MKPEEARRTIATLVWIRDSGREARAVITDLGNCEIRGCSYQNGNVTYIDQMVSEIIKADGLSNPRCYADFGKNYTQKILLVFSGSSGEAEDLFNGLAYKFTVTGSKVVLADKNKNDQEYIFEVR